MLFRTGTHSTLTSFVQDLEQECAYQVGEHGLFLPEKLIADGNGIECSYPETLGIGTAKVFRPFPGVRLVLHEGQYRSGSAFDNILASALKFENRFMFRLVEQGVFLQRFGRHHVTLARGDAVLYRLTDSAEIGLSPPINENHRYMKIFLAWMD